MNAEEIADRIALLINPMPDMSGRQINRFHGTRRRHIEELAAEIAAPASAEKSFTLEEIEALLAAERERCAKVALTVYDWSPTWTGKLHEVIASAIRSLAPQTIGDEG